ncbi:MAG: hypothetical protein HYV39_02390 [Candidatus Levybacteria bacterium]|nr:hypothetical protein [Candidatus Levybacteria bacterium]
MTEKFTYKPIGSLARVLDKFQAPEDAQEGIARRAGRVVEKGLPVSRIEHVIETSMQNNGGLADWNGVTDRIGGMVNEVYRKMKR